MPGRTRILAVALILLFLPGASSRPLVHYIFDAAWTEVHFTDVSGSAYFDDLALQGASVEVVIGTRSLRADTKTAQRELAGKNFFSAAAHPKIHFKSWRVRAIGPALAEVRGDVSIRGITRPTVLRVRLEPRQASGARRMRATTRIRRSDFGMTAYPLFVADWVEIQIDATLLPAP